jgi:hypothetical protein
MPSAEDLMMDLSDATRGARSFTTLLLISYLTLMNKTHKQCNRLYAK